jgi:HSP20 family protein
MLTIHNPFVARDINKSDRSLSEADYFGRLFQNTIDQFFSDLHTPYSNLGIECRKEDNKLIMSMDIPGIEEKDLSVEVIDKSITIKGERKNRNSKYSINKSFTIPAEYDANSLAAELANGVLTLTLAPLPKEEKIAKRIEIKSQK